MHADGDWQGKKRGGGRVAWINFARHNWIHGRTIKIWRGIDGERGFRRAYWQAADEHLFAINFLAMFTQEAINE